MLKRQLQWCLALCLPFICACEQVPEPVPLAEEIQTIHRESLSDTSWKVWVDLDESKLERQVTPELCWAACVKVINLHTLGESPSQQELHARHILTLPSNQREVAYSNEIVDALAGGYREQFNQRYVIDLDNPASLNDREIILSLSAGQPVLFGMSTSAVSSEGHIAVIYGVSYEHVEVPWEDRLLSTALDVGPDMLDWVDGLGDGENDSRQANALGQTSANISNISEAVSSLQYRITRVYVWDPANGDVDGDGRDDGGMKIYTAEQFQALNEFTISQTSALINTRERLDWVEQNGLGAGVYVRHPLTRNGEPLYAVGLGEEFDPTILSTLMATAGLATQEQRDTTEPLLGSSQTPEESPEP